MNLEPILRQNLVTLASAYSRAAGVKLSTISRYVTSDPPFFDKLVAGTAGFTIKTYDKAMAWFAENWPEGVKRPDIWIPDIPKPRPSKRSK